MSHRSVGDSEPVRQPDMTVVRRHQDLTPTPAPGVAESDITSVTLAEQVPEAVWPANGLPLPLGPKVRRG
ncbi:hypothetical protein [Nocardioides sp.]|uniref:hypothetical protein n=1 Tax=Nocardioides sp. TaxID=35761 RepID=UPI0039E30E49